MRCSHLQALKSIYRQRLLDCMLTLVRRRRRCRRYFRRCRRRRRYYYYS